ncbi:UDP-N-acetylmuramoyl-tripeptide--D-alanyl-D-alanine ligase [Halobacillus mangrovi]|uniref:UDP-N-acetylmuramoyl-tripeptide--D-alanyl-D-alanine ligase n=1 Tax=Halobacillus mangrovi TaxID=402384 RepID=A0A1W5ZW83_9BACI|nr:UDP-N-acetylmuramoyl-tripeptide--D-alanyl-D-alanine ligase [Halobacillus mangrovi]ARI77572.1 UDP-N-acetylmuramoylalanyl-D-glutamate--2,6-diaminopimelate ligase [Halobacillus mangrovi]
MIFEAQELSTLFSDFRGAARDRIPINEIMTDTRKESSQSLFVPIIGESFDAHQFLAEAIKKGAVASLWQKDRELPAMIPTDFPVFLVEDTTKGLQELATYYLNKISPIVVGVTGSNGKTTTKDMVASVLSTHFKTHKTQGNFNNHIGLPLTILNMNQDTEALVLEMGMDKAGEISVLSNLAHPDHAIITNIGESHIENLGSRKAIAAAKLEITDGLKQNGRLIIDGDEPLLFNVKKQRSTISCGFDENNAYPIVVEELSDDESVFSVTGHTYKLPMAGRHNVKNASYVIALAEQLGLTKEEVQKGFLQLEMSGMRFEKVEGLNHSLIINDAYNASPTSMRAVIEVVAQLTSKSKKVLILGDMFELGEQSEELHESVAEAIDENIHALFTIGDHSEKISKAVSQHKPTIQTSHFKDKKALCHHVRPMLTSETVVLIKASRGMKLEELLEELTE